jgi:hypothetical protein
VRYSHDFGQGFWYEPMLVGVDLQILCGEAMA